MFCSLNGGVVSLEHSRATDLHREHPPVMTDTASIVHDSRHCDCMNHPSMNTLLVCLLVCLAHHGLAQSPQDWFQMEKMLYSEPEESSSPASTEASSQAHIRSKRTYTVPSLVRVGLKHCKAIVSTATDQWCNDNCRQGYCPASHCICVENKRIPVPKYQLKPTYTFPAVKFSQLGQAPASGLSGSSQTRWWDSDRTSQVGSSGFSGSNQFGSSGFSGSSQTRAPVFAGLSNPGSNLEGQTIGSRFGTGYTGPNSYRGYRVNSIYGSSFRRKLANQDPYGGVVGTQNQNGQNNQASQQ